MAPLEPRGRLASDGEARGEGARRDMLRLIDDAYLLRPGATKPVPEDTEPAPEATKPATEPADATPKNKLTTITRGHRRNHELALDLENLPQGMASN